MSALTRRLTNLGYFHPLDSPHAWAFCLHCGQCIRVQLAGGDRTPGVICRLLEAAWDQHLLDGACGTAVAS